MGKFKIWQIASLDKGIFFVWEDNSNNISITHKIFIKNHWANFDKTWHKAICLNGIYGHSGIKIACSGLFIIGNISQLSNVALEPIGNCYLGEQCSPWASCVFNTINIITYHNISELRFLSCLHIHQQKFLWNMVLGILYIFIYFIICKSLSSLVCVVRVVAMEQVLKHG